METSVQQLSVLGNSVEIYLVILPSDVSHVSSFHEENIAQVRNVSHLAQLRQNIEDLVSYHELVLAIVNYGRPATKISNVQWPFRSWNFEM